MTQNLSNSVLSLRPLRRLKERKASSTAIVACTLGLTVAGHPVSAQDLLSIVDTQLATRSSLAAQDGLNLAGLQVWELRANPPAVTFPEIDLNAGITNIYPPPHPQDGALDVDSFVEAVVKRVNDTRFDVFLEQRSAIEMGVTPESATGLYTFSPVGNDIEVDLEVKFSVTRLADVRFYRGSAPELGGYLSPWASYATQASLDGKSQHEFRLLDQQGNDVIPPITPAGSQVNLNLTGYGAGIYSVPVFWDQQFDVTVTLPVGQYTLILSGDTEGTVSGTIGNDGRLAVIPESWGDLEVNASPFVFPGDFNGDGQVTQADMDLVLLNWGATVRPPGFVAIEQWDGRITQNELDAVNLNWGNSI